MSPLFERLGCDVTVEIDLSFKVQRLDMTVIIKNKPLCFNNIDPDYFQGFENLNDHNLISFKSFHEVFRNEDEITSPSRRTDLGQVCSI